MNDAVFEVLRQVHTIENYIIPFDEHYNQYINQTTGSTPLTYLLYAIRVNNITTNTFMNNEFSLYNFGLLGEQDFRYLMIPEQDIQRLVYYASQIVYPILNQENNQEINIPDDITEIYEDDLPDLLENVPDLLDDLPDLLENVPENDITLLYNIPPVNPRITQINMRGIRDNITPVNQNIELYHNNINDIIYY